MEDKMIDIIYDLIKDKNLYNYDNDERLRDVKFDVFTNILGNKVISLKIENSTYLICCEEV
jgi:hypothetical protein